MGFMRCCSVVLVLNVMPIFVFLNTCFSLQPGHYSDLTAPNLQPTATQERDDQCGNQHCSRELLMMGIVVPETCSAYKKYNKIISSIQLVLILQVHLYSLRLQPTETILQPDFLGRTAAQFVKLMQTFRRNYCLQSLAQKSHITCDKGPQPH